MKVCLVRPFFEEPTYLNYLNVRIGLTFQKFLGGSGPLPSPLPRDPLEPLLGLIVLRKTPLVIAKSARMVITPAVNQAGRMLHVKQLVIQDIFDKPFGNVEGVKSLADSNRVVDAIMVTENIACATLRPGQCRLLKFAIEVTTI